mmetsp:Transcript_23812/g.62328  ORF Transcript_23812/g.62328 Transcript_23812/m.62328 type:complete len:212 (-) Transcript_23812:1098-1733(-)
MALPSPPPSPSCHGGVRAPPGRRCTLAVIARTSGLGCGSGAVTRLCRRRNCAGTSPPPALLGLRGGYAPPATAGRLPPCAVAARRISTLALSVIERTSLVGGTVTGPTISLEGDAAASSTSSVVLSPPKLGSVVKGRGRSWSGGDRICMVTIDERRGTLDLTVIGWGDGSASCQPILPSRTYAACWWSNVADLTEVRMRSTVNPGTTILSI